MSEQHRLLTNLEGRHDFDVRWPRDFRSLIPGVTAVLRVKDEARSLPWVLPPLFEAVQHVVLVDNQSTDGSPEVARDVAGRLGVPDRLTLAAYPFDVSRCGSEHLATPEGSVHNLAYFYNWAFSHVRTQYSMKWDGDMVLTAEGVQTFAALAWQLESVEAVVLMPRHPLFVESDRVAWLDVYLENVEEYVFPMGEDYRHVKAYEWEMRMVPKRARRLRLPEGLCLELKYLDSDEFDHWVDPDSFGTTRRTLRKQREWEVFHALREGRQVPGVVRIEAPPDYSHVVDYATEVWLPRRQRPITVPEDDRHDVSRARPTAGGD
ncbi:glycosyltransferase family 2 protein [Nocardioides ferulae]|uniref:glycosyltransferase family 2 protein n=1 Tax=Nocardioides ferulae TaxID=2340821 RepID=UPI000EB50784|nr:glycosyltransferase [Nocardioides ferulae]